MENKNKYGDEYVKYIMKLLYDIDIDEVKEADKKLGEIAENDNVNHPKHYTTGKYEVIDILKDKMGEDEFKGFLRGNVLKYVFRFEDKNGLEDLKKAQWYLDRLIREYI